MKNFKILLIVIILAHGVACEAQIRKYTNEFLNIGVDARSLGMGTAVVATSSDAAAGFWNPAGMLNLKNPFQVTLMHSPYFSGIANLDYGAITKKINQDNAFGISMIRFGIDNIPNTLDLYEPGGQINYNRVKSFSAVDYAFLLSYAKRAKDENMILGGSAKIIRRKIGDFASGWGFGIDFGLQKKVNEWVFALMGRDVTFTFTGWKMNLTDREKELLTQAGNDIPKSSIEVTSPRIIGGLSRKITLQEEITLTPELDLNFSLDGKRNALLKTNAFSMSPTLGVEFNYKDLVFVRTGVQNIQQVKDINGRSHGNAQPTIGAGMRLKAFSIDYAFTDVAGSASAALYSHIFSLKLSIGESEE
jgi:hypothetical protein